MNGTAARVMGSEAVGHKQGADMLIRRRTAFRCGHGGRAVRDGGREQRPGRLSGRNRCEPRSCRRRSGPCGYNFGIPGGCVGLGLDTTGSVTPATTPPGNSGTATAAIAGLSGGGGCYGQRISVRRSLDGKRASFCVLRRRRRHRSRRKLCFRIPATFGYVALHRRPGRSDHHNPDRVFLHYRRFDATGPDRSPRAS